MGKLEQDIVFGESTSAEMLQFFTSFPDLDAEDKVRPEPCVLLPEPVLSSRLKFAFVAQCIGCCDHRMHGQPCVCLVFASKQPALAGKSLDKIYASVVC